MDAQQQYDGDACQAISRSNARRRAIIQVRLSFPGQTGVGSTLACPLQGRNERQGGDERALRT